MTISRNEFLWKSAALAVGTSLIPSLSFSQPRVRHFGVQLYTFRDEMATDARGTLEKIANLGIREIESARSRKGHYYGLTPREMKDACTDLGMKLVSGHVHLDDQWNSTVEEAVASGQSYLICSSLPSRGQTLDNYKKVAEAFNKAGETCREAGLKFGYHNHDYEFESDQGQVLYEVLLKETDPELVHMELDLGWVVASGFDPADYFSRYPGRFPLWHLKDMDLEEKKSTEFGKGGLDLADIMARQKESGVKHIFIEQEEYSSTPFESMQHNMAFLKKL